MLGRLDNIDLLCSDVAEMAGFYLGTLGLTPRFPYQPGDEWFAFQAGDVTVYVFPGTGEHAPPFGPETAGNPPGIESFCFAVADLDAAIEHLGEDVRWLGPAREWHHPSGTWYRFRAFHDPEGNKLSITEPHAA